MEIRVRVESTFKLLGIDLSILIQNVCVHLGNHVDLSMTGITLSGLQVTVIQFELICCAGMTKGVEYNIGESSILLEIVKLFFENSLLAGTPIGLCDNKIEVLVLVSKKTFQFQLVVIGIASLIP